MNVAIIDADIIVKPNVTEGMEWVLNDEGVATVKFDGSCCAIINGEFYKRYDVKRGKRLQMAQSLVVRQIR